MAKTEEDIIKLITSRKTLTSADETARNSNFNNWKQMYLNRYTSSRMRATTSRIHNPRLYGLVEYEIASMTASDPKGQFSPRDDSFEASTYEVNEDYKHRWKRANMALLQMNALWYELTMGFSVSRLTWKYERKKLKNKKGKLEWMPTYDSWAVDLIPTDNFYPDPSHDPAIPYKYAKWGIVTEKVSLKSLEAINKLNGKVKYQNLKLLKDMMKDTNPSDNQFKGINASDQIRGLQSNPTRKEDTTSDKFELIMMYEQDQWYGLAKDYDVLVLNIPNPYDHKELPIHLGFTTILADSTEGISDIGIIQDVADADNTLMSSYMDTVDLYINPVLKAAPGQPTEGLVFAAGRILREIVPNGITQFQMRNNGADTFQQAHQLLGQAMQDATGNIDTTLPTAQSTALQKTATGVKDASIQRNARTSKKIKVHTETFIIPIAEQALKLTYQRVTEPYTIAVKDKQTINYFTKKMETNNPQVVVKGKTQPKYRMDDTKKTMFVTLTKEDFYGDYSYEANSEDQLQNDSTVQWQNFTEYLQMLTNPEYVQGLQREGKDINYSEILERGASILNIKNADEFLTNFQEQQAQGGQPGPSIRDNVSMNYKDVPPDVQREIEQMSGLQPSQMAQQPQGAMSPQQGVQPQMPQGQPQQPDPRVMQLAQALVSGRINAQDPKVQQDPMFQQAVQLIQQSRQQQGGQQ